MSQTKPKPGATSEGTTSYFRNRTPGVPFGKTGWTVSPVGFGGYRIQEGNETHREALRQALTSGCNLIDTSTNYTNGSSERLIGSVLQELFEAGSLKREQLVVVTKAGYVQGENQNIAREREERGNPFPELVKISPEVWHCISPEFLEDQITRSLERLGLEQLDVLLLHNPEYFLKANPEHSEYYKRIRRAFEHLETEVSRGRIQCYGVSSNTLPDPKESPDYTSFEMLLELAEETAPGKNRFRVVQFPFNLIESGATFEPNNHGKSVCELAHEKGIATLANRPLNAFLDASHSGGRQQGSQLIRLAEFPSHHGIDVPQLLQNALNRTIEMEARYPGKSILPANQIMFGHVLHHNIGRLADLDTWKTVLNYQILPALEESREILSREPASREWIAEYEKVAPALFQAFTAYLESESAMRSRRLDAALDQAVPALRASKTLSQKALRIYRSGIGIDCVLVGMRTPAYVADALTLAPPLKPDEALSALEAAHEFFVELGSE